MRALREESVPAAFDENVTAVTRFPARAFPLTITAWRNFPAAGYPDVGAAIMPPEAGHPNGVARRPMAFIDIFAARWRRTLADDVNLAPPFVLNTITVLSPAPAK